jgi:Acyl-CoA synthetases (AMP-forming)/AMP-acid ligases II
VTKEYLVLENWLKKQVKLNPNKTALILEHSDFTFSELDQSVQVFASKLSGYGIKINDRVAVFIANSFNGYVAILALQQLGCQIVFLNTRLSKDELSYQLNDSKAKLCLVDDDTNKEEIIAVEFNKILISKVLSLASDKEYRPVKEFDSDTITSIMYTSGTSGTPKGCAANFW